MRTSVRIKNIVAKILMVIGVFFVIGAGCTVDVSTDYAHILKTGFMGAITAWFGWELYKW